MNIIKELDSIAFNLKMLKDNCETNYNLEKAIEDINIVKEKLKEIAKKYDYSKLPYDL